MLSRVLPFALFMAFIGLNALLEALAPQAEWLAVAKLWLYPVRTLVVGAALIFYWRSYDELRRGAWGGIGNTALAVAVGVAVYFAWIQMEWPWAMQGEGGAGYNPFLIEGAAGYFLAAFRLLGAAALVPVMEELF